MQTTPHILLQAVDELARLAGDAAMRFFGKRVTVDTKADGSPVTEADRTVEHLVRDWIAKRFPADGILGEELGAVRTGADREWLIDPIDGTLSFVRGVPLWGVMIGVVEHGRPVAGAVNCAAAGELVVAADGCGCWHNHTQTQVSSVSDLRVATVLATDDRFRYNPSRVARWANLSAHVAVSRTWGDCYGYVLVATGRAEVMVDDRLSPWDSLPLAPIITEAGGVFTDWNGCTETVGADGIATNAALAASVRAMLVPPKL